MSNKRNQVYYDRETAVERDERVTTEIEPNYMEAVFFSDSFNRTLITNQWYARHHPFNVLDQFLGYHKIILVKDMLHRDYKRVTLYAFVERKTEDFLWLRDNTGGIIIKYKLKNELKPFVGQIVWIKLRRKKQYFLIKDIVLVIKS